MAAAEKKIDMSGFAFSSEETSRCELRHPQTDEFLTDGEGNTAWIEVINPDNTEFKEHVHVRNNERLKRAQRRGKASGFLTSEMIQQDAIEDAAFSTRAWYLVDLRGNHIDLQCKLVTARELYETFSWILEQVQIHQEDRSNFTTG